MPQSNNANTNCPRITGLSQIADNYDALLCDVWGVVHNGVAATQTAVNALRDFKQSGKPTFLLTNAPRPNAQVIKQLAGLDISHEQTFDQIVTSGDVTRQMIGSIDKKLFHIGTVFDKSIFDGLNVELTAWENASSVLCTGLYDDFNETPDDYDDLLQKLLSRNLPFICANPDIVVEHGGIMRYCAGALAAKYSKMGGETIIVGKPHKPVYDHAIELIDQFSGHKIEMKKILAVGDGINTDIAGAIDFGLDVLFISAGIHAAEYGSVENPDEAKLQTFLNNHNANPVAWMPRLAW